MSYNLLDEKWIPVLYHDGKWERLGILKTLADAHLIRQLATSNPMDRVAIIRFLLALLYWCRGNPPPDRDAYPPGSFPPEWFTKLEENRECFELLGDGKRFYQDLSIKDEQHTVGASNLIHDLPSGTNIAHFWHVRDKREGLCLACCALGLLRWSAISTAGLAGPGLSMTASLHGNTPAYVYPIGVNLWWTLQNMVVDKSLEEDDFPIWDENADEEKPLGLLKGLTWRGRKIFLAPVHDTKARNFETGACIYCGTKVEQLVKTIVFRPGWNVKGITWNKDPFLLTITEGKKQIIPDYPTPNSPLEEIFNLWYKIYKAILQRENRRNYDVSTLHIVLFANSQSLYKHVTDFEIVVPALTSRKVERLLEELEWLRKTSDQTVSGGTSRITERPKSNLLVNALSPEKRIAIGVRTVLTDLGETVNQRFKTSFDDLIYSLAKQSDSEEDLNPIITYWHNQIKAIIGDHALRVTSNSMGNSLINDIVRRESVIFAMEQLFGKESQ